VQVSSLQQQMSDMQEAAATWRAHQVTHAASVSPCSSPVNLAMTCRTCDINSAATHIMAEGATMSHAPAAAYCCNRGEAASNTLYMRPVSSWSGMALHSLTGGMRLAVSPRTTAGRS
jgi:hypothetical protein